MIRKIIKIDKEKCNGCGACASACHEGAIEMVNGKAVLTREDYCDGLGDCLPTCPVDAISFEMREAPAYDEEAVKASQKAKQKLHSGCPGSRSMSINHEKEVDNTDLLYQVSFLNGLFKLSLCRLMHLILTVQTSLLPLIARLMPTAISTTISSKTRLLL